MALLTVLPFSGIVEELRLRPSRDLGFEKSATGTMMLGLGGPEGDCHTGETRAADSRTLPLYKRGVTIRTGETRAADSRTLPLYKRGVTIRNVRQITLLAVEELAEIAARLGIPAIDPGWFGANVVVSGIPDFTLLPPSTRLQFPSGATLVVDMENMPCSQIAKVVDQYHPGSRSKVVEAAMHKRGLTAWVEREGLVATGDAVRVVCPPNRLYPHMPS